MRIFLRHWVLYLLTGLLFVVYAPRLSLADDTKKSFEERKHEQANALRQQSMDRARAQLGFEFVHPGYANRRIDFWALSAQAARLGAMLDATLSQMTNTHPRYGQHLVVPPGSPAGLTPGAPATSYLSSTYGPEGPTAKSVRALLEYRLVVIGNPRLTVGKVEESEDRVVADIVTKEGSLVDRYSIDKKTGAWDPQR